MRSITLAELRHGMRRFVSPAVAVLLGVAFVAATFTLSSSMQRTVEHAAAQEVSGYSTVASDPSASRGGNADGVLGPKDVAALRAVPGVDRVDIEQSAIVPAKSAARTDVQATTVLPERIELLSGHQPRAPGEVLITSEAAAALGARPGSTVTIGGSPGTAERRTVAGVADVETKGGLPVVVATPQQITSWSGAAHYSSLLVDGGSPAQVRDAVGAGATVRTAQAEADHRTEQMVTGIDFVTTFFAMFAVVALFVAGLVIANTFQILLAQRTRQLALLRCVGASRRQITRTVRGEALILGLVASLVGAALGVGLVGIVVQVSGGADLTAMPLDHFAVNVPGVLGAVALGVVVTVASALLPARRAARVTPLAALRPEPVPTGRSRASAVRVAIGSAVAGLGFGGLILGALNGSAAIAVPAGVLSFLGVVLTAPVVVPAIARQLGRVMGRLGGVPGELATDNTVRNPRRTSATSTALLVGITLMATMLVGATTSKTVVDREIDEQYAIDVQVTAQQGLPQSVQREVGQVEDVRSAAALPADELTVKGPRQSESAAVVGVPESARGVLRDASALNGLRSGQVLVDESTADDYGLEDGSSVEVGGRSFTAHLVDRMEGFTLTAADLRAVAPDAPVSAMWLRLAPGAEPGAVVDDLTETTSDTGAKIDGAAGARAELDQMVTLMLLIVGALLAVAVLIALVGVANTLGLSVLERRRETALLRALGFTARQVRRTLAYEALIVSLVAAVVGTGLGLLYGWAGTRSLLGTYAAGTLPQVPWVPLLGLVATAAACGLIASWAPARRAARTSPVAALAAE